MHERRLSVLLGDDFLRSGLKTNLLNGASLFIRFYDWGVIEGRFARTKTPTSDYK